MTLPSFNPERYQFAKQLLAARLAYMMGRKLEEGDWAHVYCNALGINVPEWSNLNADVTVSGLSLEHKMMCVSESQAIRVHCGTDMMHPALTRRVTLPDTADPTEAMLAVIEGYERVLAHRRAQARALTASGVVELRSGWLIYESSLSEFLYFEEPSVNLNPAEHRAVWSERARSGQGGRRSNRNLWIYNLTTAKKIWSVTGGASGTKIQPYFTVPAADDPNLHYFRVQGDPTGPGTVCVWLTMPTARTLEHLIGSLEIESVSAAILTSTACDLPSTEGGQIDPVRAIYLSLDAYNDLKQKFSGKSDEIRFQLLCKHLTTSR